MNSRAAGEERGAVQMGEEPSAPAEDPDPTVDVTPEEATARHRGAIQDWLPRRRDAERRLVLLRSPAGLGKTRTAVEEELRAMTGLAPGERFTDDYCLGQLPAHDPGKMLCAVPRHALAHEVKVLNDDRNEATAWHSWFLQSDWREEWFGIPILEGRSPDNCCRFALVQLAEANGHAPGSLCKRAVFGETLYCSHFHECPYQGNLARVQDADNAICTHAHLAIPYHPALNLDARKRLWIDEDPTSTFRDEETFADAELRFIAEGEESRTNAFVLLARFGADVVDGIDAPVGLLSALTDRGWNADSIDRAARQRAQIEEEHRQKRQLDPSRTDAELSSTLVRHKPLKHLAIVLHRLAAEMRRRSRGESYSLLRAGGRIRAQGRKPTDALPPNILITDATANPLILGALFPSYTVEVIEIAVRRNARVVQVSNLSFSRNWLVHQGHLAEVTEWIAATALRYRKLVVLTTKKLRCAITGEEPKGKLSVSTKALGATIGHYGNLRGSNAFEDCDAILVLGRECPEVDDIEGAAMQIWYDTSEPLQLILADSKGRKSYPLVPQAVQMRDGTTRSVRVPCHPDPRCQAVLEMPRENELSQAIDRARLIWNEEPKDVFVLTNIPLRGLVIDAHVPWDVLRGADKLSRAAGEAVQRGWCALPLAPAWLTARFPMLWRSEEAAEKYLRSALGRGFIELAAIGTVAALIERLSDGRRFQSRVCWVLIEYRQAKAGRGGARRWSRALIDAGVDERHWPRVLGAVLDVAPASLELRKVGTPRCSEPPRPERAEAETEEEVFA